MIISIHISSLVILLLFFSRRLMCSHLNSISPGNEDDPRFKVGVSDVPLSIPETAEEELEPPEWRGNSPQFGKPPEQWDSMINKAKALISKHRSKKIFFNPKLKWPGEEPTINEEPIMEEREIKLKTAALASDPGPAFYAMEKQSDRNLRQVPSETDVAMKNVISAPEVRAIRNGMNEDAVPRKKSPRIIASKVSVNTTKKSKTSVGGLKRGSKKDDLDLDDWERNPIQVDSKYFHRQSTGIWKDIHAVVGDHSVKNGVRANGLDGTVTVRGNVTTVPGIEMDNIQNSGNAGAYSGSSCNENSYNVNSAYNPCPYKPEYRDAIVPETGD